MGRGRRDPVVHDHFTDVEKDLTGSSGKYRNPRVQCKHCSKEMSKNATSQGLHLKKCVPYLVFAPDAADDSFGAGDDSLGVGDKSMGDASESSIGRGSGSPTRPKLVARLFGHFPALNGDGMAGTEGSIEREDSTGIKGEACVLTERAQDRSEGDTGGSVLQAAAAGNVNAAIQPSPVQPAPAEDEDTASLRRYLLQASEAVRITEAKIKEMEAKLQEKQDQLVRQRKVEDAMGEALRAVEALKK